jgi:hypothetical protein
MQGIFWELPQRAAKEAVPLRLVFEQSLSKGEYPAPVKRDSAGAAPDIPRGRSPAAISIPAKAAEPSARELPLII